jgi:hypothetical protein
MGPAAPVFPAGHYSPAPTGLSRTVPWREDHGFRWSWNIVSRQFDKVAATMSCPEGLLQQIKACNAVYYVHFPVRIGDRYEIFEGAGAPGTRTPTRRSTRAASWSSPTSISTPAA